MLIAFVSLIVLGCAAWVLNLIGALLTLKAVPKLIDLDPEPPSAWPLLSIVVPACNEADTIEAAMTSLLATDYPNLEVVLVEDRSDDGTPEIVDRIAASDDRVRALHIDHLPENWLGKVHALHRGSLQARGEWVLYTDADVHFAPDAIGKAVAYAIGEGVDHLAIIPQMASGSVLVDCAVATAFRAITFSTRPWKVTDPKSSAFIGSGGFNLVRKKAFDDTQGFEWLRMEVADDLGVGLLMKSNGFRPGVLMGTEAVRVRWYTSVPQLARGMEKNAWGNVARLSVARGLTLCGVALFVSLAPFIALLPWGVPYLWVGAVAAYVALAVNAVVMGPYAGLPRWTLFLSAPLGDLVMVAVTFRAVLLGAAKGGVTWRGTLYPSAALKAGMRVKF